VILFKFWLSSNCIFEIPPIENQTVFAYGSIDLSINEEIKNVATYPLWHYNTVH